MRPILLAILLLLPASLVAQDGGVTPSPDGRPWFVVHLPQEQRERFRNPDGSCVQCSIGLSGVACNVPAAEYLLWDSQYGGKVRGGSDPSRVKAYCNARGIAAYNVYGTESAQWVFWALQSGRPVAITWSTNHMITAVGFSGELLDDKSYIAICDNNSPWKVQWIPMRDFLRWHQAFSGGWCVILKTAPPAGKAQFVAWWETQP